MAIKKIKGITIEIGGDTKKLNKALSDVNATSKQTQDELKSVNKLLKLQPGNADAVAQKQELLGKAAKDAATKLEILQAGDKALEDQYKNGKITEQEYIEQKRKMQREIGFAEVALHKLEKQIGRSTDKWRDMSIKMQAAGKQMQKMGESMANVGKKMAMGISAPLLALGGLATKSAIDFESAFAGVVKTVDATDAELAQLKEGIRSMAKEIPAAATEIAEVGEAAGQLGIHTPNILSFTRSMIDMGEATNLSATEAASAFARFANIMQMPQTEFDRLGSSVVELGNSSATTESEIIDMGLRLAAAGKQANMTEAEVMGIAAALSSLGLESQAGGSAFSKVIMKMQTAVETGNKSLADFASVAGMSADEFKKAFQDNAANALGAFVTGLGDTERIGKSATVMLDEMGLKELRLNDALKRTAGSGTLFADSIKMSSEAWEKNNALTKEAEQRYATTESQLKIFKNKMADLGISFGELILPTLTKLAEKIGKVIDSFNKLSPAAKNLIVKVGMVAAAMGPVLFLGGKLLSGVGFLTKGLGGLVLKIGPLLKGTKALGVAAGTANAGLTGFGRALTGLISPAGLVTAAIGGIVVAGVALNKWLNEPSVEEVDLFDGISDGASESLRAFEELSSGAMNELRYLKSAGIPLSKEAADGMSEKFKQMKDQVVASLEEQKKESVKILMDWLSQIEGINTSENAEIVSGYQKGMDEKIKMVKNAEARIQEILNIAQKEKRSLNQSEFDEYMKLQKQINDTAIQTFTKTQGELALIQQRMGKGSLAKSKENARETIKLSLQNKDEQINIIEEEAKAREDILSSMVGVSNEKRLEMQKSSDSIREKALKNVEQQHKDVIKELEDMGVEVTAFLDTESGEWLTKGERMNALSAQQMQARSSTVIGSHKDMAKSSKETADKMKAAMENASQSMASSNAAVSSSTIKMGEKLYNVASVVKEYFVRWPGEMEKTFAGIPEFFSKTFSDAWKSIKEAFASVKTFFNEKLENIKGVFSAENFKKIFIDGIGGGLLKAKDSIVEKAGIVWAAIKNAFKKLINVRFGFSGVGGGAGYGGDIGSVSWAKARVTQGFMKNGHHGVDFGVPTGTPIRTPVGGKVVVSKDLAGSYGRYVVIADSGNNYHYFAHLSKRNVGVGTTVPKGALVGFSGNTGNSTGPHLHYEVRKNNIYSQQLSPWQFLKGYRTGGFPLVGEIFKANESGIEMMGKMGSKPVVANNMQIVEGISAAVQRGMTTAIYQASIAPAPIQKPQSLNLSQVGDQLQDALSGMEIVLDSGAVVGHLYPAFDKKMAIQLNRRVRGR
jgi:TP901 family phage tail tape measure protein